MNLMKKIKIGIVGYGNLGKGVELAVRKQPDMELVGIFTRRDPKTLIPQYSDTMVFSMDEMVHYKDMIHVMILCGGSAKDLPKQSPTLVKMFNIVDSFDTHKEIPNHYQQVNEAAKQAGTVGIISVGWDPGLFSLMRMLGDAILPKGHTYTFWGRGVSQGHSDAIRKIKGVKGAVQYTIPSSEALEQVRRGEEPNLTTREKHRRECYVVPQEGADLETIRQEIITMPNYFADYDTQVYFISEEELQRNHSAMPHGGRVIHSAKTGRNEQNHQKIEFGLTLDSNPEFTSSVLVAYARAAYALQKEGYTGAKTVLDIPPRHLSWKSQEELQKEVL